MHLSLRWDGGGCHGDMSTKPSSRSKVMSLYRYEHKEGHGRLRNTVTSHLQEATPGD